MLILVPWALPGTVVAVSVAEAYGRPRLLLGSFILVGTFWILPVVYFLRFMPLVVRALQASMEQLDPTLEEAAGSLGARAWQRFMRVTLPLVWPGAVPGFDAVLLFVIAGLVPATHGATSPNGSNSGTMVSRATSAGMTRWIFYLRSWSSFIRSSAFVRFVSILA